MTFLQTHKEPTPLRSATSPRPSSAKQAA